MPHRARNGRIARATRARKRAFRRRERARHLHVKRRALHIAQTRVRPRQRALALRQNITLHIRRARVRVTRATKLFGALASSRQRLGSGRVRRAREDILARTRGGSRSRRAPHRLLDARARELAPSARVAQRALRVIHDDGETSLGDGR